MNDFTEKLVKIDFNKESVAAVPEEPGIYAFWDRNGKPHYVGKSISLKNRLASYLSPAITGKTREMIKDTDKFSYIRVNSELESLLLEARLIKLLFPKYNIELKDDKHPLYIKITNDPCPLIVTARKGDLENGVFVYGPFPSSYTVKSFLRKVRRIIPFSDHKLGKKPCIYNQIGLCSPCPNAINLMADVKNKRKLITLYRRNIQLIKKILDGKIETVYKYFSQKMDAYSKDSDFENAIKMRDQIRGLEYISQSVTSPNEFLKNPNLLFDTRDKERKQLNAVLRPFFGNREYRRIECYDIAHLAGTKPTSSMVTFIDGEADKSLYRRFKIDSKKGGDDYSSLKEVAIRRIRHLKDWGAPDLMIIDGGKGQVTSFTAVFRKAEIPIIGLAKRFETIVIPNLEDKTKFTEIRIPRSNVLNLLQRIRNEAHRFARRYHHHLVEKDYVLR